MLIGPGQIAHERLAALARRRLRDAAGGGAMSDGMRARLQREVARQAEVGPGMPEPVPIPAVAAWWRGWRAWVGMIGVGLAVTVVLLLVIRSGPVGGRRGDFAASGGGRAEAPVGSERFRGGLDAIPAVAPIALDAPPEPSAPMALATGVGFAANPEVAPILDPVGSRKVRNLEGVVRLRRTYAAPTNGLSTNARPPLLRRFEVVRTAERLELRDDDGSIYVGRVETGPGTSALGAAGWVFEGRGTNVASGKVVSITGLFGPASETRGQEAGPISLLDLPFSGTVIVGEAEGLEVRAEPEP